MCPIWVESDAGKYIGCKIRKKKKLQVPEEWTGMQDRRRMICGNFPQRNGADPRDFRWTIVDKRDFKKLPVSKPENCHTLAQ